jgi:hypothetical protein
MITISPLASPIKGAAILTEDQAKALLGGNMYIDVHSAKTQTAKFVDNSRLRDELRLTGSTNRP